MTKKSRRHGFLDRMSLSVSIAELVLLIVPSAPTHGAKGGRLPFAIETMCRIHFIQQWFNHSDPAMEVTCYVFESLQEVRDMTADWLHRYNHQRPHESVGRIPPVEYRVKLFPNLYF